MSKVKKTIHHFLELNKYTKKISCNATPFLSVKLKT